MTALLAVIEDVTLGTIPTAATTAASSSATAGAGIAYAVTVTVGLVRVGVVDAAVGYISYPITIGIRLVGVGVVGISPPFIQPRSNFTPGPVFGGRSYGPFSNLLSK